MQASSHPAGRPSGWPPRLGSLTSLRQRLAARAGERWPQLSGITVRWPSGHPAGTPQEALDCACGLYLGDTTAWLDPPPPTS